MESKPKLLLLKPDILDEEIIERAEKTPFQGSQSSRSVVKIPLAVLCLLGFAGISFSVFQSPRVNWLHVFVVVLFLLSFLLFSIWGTINGYLAISRQEPFSAKYFGLVINGLLAVGLLLVVGWLFDTIAFAI